jgi:hypothetical protein
MNSSRRRLNLYSGNLRNRFGLSDRGCGWFQIGAEHIHKLLNAVYVALSNGTIAQLSGGRRAVGI